MKCVTLTVIRESPRAPSPTLVARSIRRIESGKYATAERYDSDSSESEESSSEEDEESSEEENRYETRKMSLSDDVSSEEDDDEHVGQVKHRGKKGANGDISSSLESDDFQALSLNARQSYPSDFRPEDEMDDYPNVAESHHAADEEDGHFSPDSIEEKHAQRNKGVYEESLIAPRGRKTLETGPDGIAIVLDPPSEAESSKAASDVVEEEPFVIEKRSKQVESSADQVDLDVEGYDEDLGQFH